MKKDIAIVGAGGFGREVACIIRNIDESVGEQWNFIGFFDDGLPKESKNNYGEVLGSVDELNKWATPLDIVVAIGNPQILQRVVERITNPLVSFPNIIAPDILYFDNYFASIGRGNIISYKTSISCNVSLGDFNILNGMIVIGHDVKIGNYNAVMTNVNISGGVEIGDENFFGVQSILLQYTKVGNRVRVGAGSVIIRKTKDDSLYMGNPAIKINL